MTRSNAKAANDAKVLHLVKGVEKTINQQQNTTAQPLLRRSDLRLHNLQQELVEVDGEIAILASQIKNEDGRHKQAVAGEGDRHTAAVQTEKVRHEDAVASEDRLHAAALSGLSVNKQDAESVRSAILADIDALQAALGVGGAE